MTTLPSGAQYAIASGPYRAVVTQMGATLRSFSFEGNELLWTFTEDQAPVSSQGRHLVPWPNRIRDGRYVFDGSEFQLPITEVERHTALHGLGAGLGWDLLSQDEHEVVLRTLFFAQPGWPGGLEMVISHRIGPEGLVVTVTAANVGSTRLPYGYGAHPYFKANLAGSELAFSFTRELAVDSLRLLPIEVVDLTSEHDFRQRRRLGDTVFDTALTGVEGSWAVDLWTGEHDIRFWADDRFGWCQIFTHQRRDAIAIEPMTCGPDAFNEGPTHADLIVLAPGDIVTCRWGIQVAL